MNIRTQVKIWEVDGDRTPDIDQVLTTLAHTAFLKNTQTLDAGVKTQVNLSGISEAQLVFIKPTTNPVKIYKDHSAECWEVTGVFLAAGCNIAALHLEADSDTTVEIYISGD